MQETTEEHLGSLVESREFLVIGASGEEKEDDTKYRDSLFGQNKEAASTSGKNSTSFHAKRDPIPDPKPSSP